MSNKRKHQEVSLPEYKDCNQLLTDIPFHDLLDSDPFSVSKAPDSQDIFSCIFHFNNRALPINITCVDYSYPDFEWSVGFKSNQSAALCFTMHGLPSSRCLDGKLISSNITSPYYNTRLKHKSYNSYRTDFNVATSIYVEGIYPRNFYSIHEEKNVSKTIQLTGNFLLELINHITIQTGIKTVTLLDVSRIDYNRHFSIRLDQLGMILDPNSNGWYSRHGYLPTAKTQAMAWREYYKFKRTCHKFLQALFFNQGTSRLVIHRQVSGQPTFNQGNLFTSHLLTLHQILLNSKQEDDPVKNQAYMDGIQFLIQNLPAESPWFKTRHQVLKWMAQKVMQLKPNNFVTKAPGDNSATKAPGNNVVSIETTHQTNAILAAYHIMWEFTSRDTYFDFDLERNLTKWYE